MQTDLNHLQFNVDPANLSFYRELLGFLGWQTIYDDHGMLGLGIASGVSLWFVGAVKPVSNDYDGPGLNHLALGASSVADVDATAVYLQDHSVALLFETPRHRAEFSRDAEHTYYQVMFETPDGLLIEVVYQGPKG